MLTHNAFVKIVKSNLSQSYWDKINSELSLHGFKSPSSDPIQFLRFVLDNPEAFKQNYVKSCRRSRSITPTINAWENMLDIPQIKDALQESHGPVLHALKEFQKEIIALLEEKEKSSKVNAVQTQTNPHADDLQDTIDTITPMSSPPERPENTHAPSQPRRATTSPPTHHNIPIALMCLQNILSKLDHFASTYDKPHVKLMTHNLHTDIKFVDHLFRN